jgi:hypothetical protein
MMGLARRASLLVAFYLLASAATAYAECAWVLWGWTEPHDAANWMRIGYYETNDACWERIAARTGIPRSGAQQMGPHGIKYDNVARLDNGIDVGRGSVSGSPAFSYRCLPDTVDPRGPKSR